MVRCAPCFHTVICSTECAATAPSPRCIPTAAPPQFNHRISVVSHATGIITLFAGAAGHNMYGSFGGDGAAATSANLNSPGGIAIDAFGTLFIADTVRRTHAQWPQRCLRFRVPHARRTATRQCLPLHTRVIGG